MPWTYDAVHIGDSLSLGQAGGKDISSRLATTNGWSVLTRGVGGETSADILARFQTDAIDVDAERIFITAGTNDVHLSPFILPAGTIANYTSMQDLVEAADPTPTVIFNETCPRRWNGTKPQTIRDEDEVHEFIKLLNAEVRKFCTDNGYLFGPSYQEMCETVVALNGDDMSTNYSNPPPDSGIHPKTAGYNRMADMYNLNAVPTRLYRWGSALTWVSDESWDWFILGGSASISGDADTGTLVLPTGDTGDSTVKCLEAGTLTHTITATVASGTASYQYRTSSSNYDRDDVSPSWSNYTTPFTTSDQFVQIRATGTSGADANISDISLTWGAIRPGYMFNMLGRRLFKESTL